ncbi:MAG TPA: glycosyltransferase family 2 protein [Pengzhenrongella sp.]
MERWLGGSVPGVWVVIPALDEAENLSELLPRVLAQEVLVASGGTVLVVDDGSRDGTDQVVRELAAAGAGVDLLRFGRNRGKAAALQAGFARAVDGGASIVVMMDADGQDDPEELGRLVASLEDGVDLVTGARVVRRDRFIKRTTSRLYNRVTAALSGVPGRDFNSGYKAMRAEVARDVSPMMYGEMHRYLTVIAVWSGYEVVEVPVEHHERMHGRTKYGLARFWRGFVDLLTIRFLMSYENRPSHLFGGVGLGMGAVGGLMLAYLLGVWVSGESIGDRPMLIAAVLFVVVGIQLLLFGLHAELTVYTRHATYAAVRRGAIDDRGRSVVELKEPHDQERVGRSRPGGSPSGPGSEDRPQSATA